MVKVADKLNLEKGISNLAIAAGAALVAKNVANAESKRPKLKKFWVVEMILLSLAAFIGSIVHSFAWGKKANGIIWGVLLAIEFETVRRFYEIISMFDEDYKVKNRDLYIIIGLEIALYIPATVIRFLTGKNTFTFFIGYCSVVAVMIGMLFKNEKATPATRDLGVSVLTLLMAVFSQLAIKDYGATVAHIFIILALLPLKNAAIKSFN